MKKQITFSADAGVTAGWQENGSKLLGIFSSKISIKPYLLSLMTVFSSRYTNFSE